MPRHTAPRVTAVVLNRLYQTALSLEDAVQHIAEGALPAAPRGGAAAGAGPPVPGPQQPNPQHQPQQDEEMADGQQQQQQDGDEQQQHQPQQQQQQQQHVRVTIALAQPGDSRAYRHHLLQRTVVAVPPDAPGLRGQPLRLSQRSTQQQVSGGGAGGGEGWERMTTLGAVVGRGVACMAA